MPKIMLKLLLVLAVVFLPLCAGAQEITGPKVGINDGHVIVSTGLELDEEQLVEVSKGISKEIDLYVDLFRVWPSWPDEFIIGDKFIKTISCDPVKKEFVATSLHENILREKRFSDCKTLLKWALTIDAHELTSTAGLEPAEYFVKVRAESRIRRLPPVVGYLFFFVKEKEYKVSASSAPFRILDKEEPGK